MKTALALAAALLCLSLPALASTGTIAKIAKVPQPAGAPSFNPTSYTGAITPDKGGAAVPFTAINGMNGIDFSKLKAGTRVEYSELVMGGFAGTRIDLVKILDGSNPSPAPKPAPAAAAAQPTGTVKTWDAASRTGTVAPAAGGPELYFAVDPGAKGDIKVGAKITYVQVLATGVAP